MRWKSTNNNRLNFCDVHGIHKQNYCRRSSRYKHKHKHAATTKLDKNPYGMVYIIVDLTYFISEILGLFGKFRGQYYPHGNPQRTSRSEAVEDLSMDRL